MHSSNMILLIIRIADLCVSCHTWDLNIGQNARATLLTPVSWCYGKCPGTIPKVFKSQIGPDPKFSLDSQFYGNHGAPHTILLY